MCAGACGAGGRQGEPEAPACVAQELHGGPGVRGPTLGLAGRATRSGGCEEAIKVSVAPLRPPPLARGGGLTKQFTPLGRDFGGVFVRLVPENFSEGSSKRRR